MKQQQSGAPEKLKINKPSSLLTAEENEHIFSLLGRRCQVIALEIYFLCKVKLLPSILNCEHKFHCSLWQQLLFNFIQQKHQLIRYG